MSFTANMTSGLSTSDGISLSRTLNGQAMGAKALLDDTFAAPAVIDLAPLIASITTPKMVLMVCDGDGTLIDFDGIGPSVKAFRTLQLEIAIAPAGLLDLEISPQGASQRIRFLCIGD